MSAPAGGSDTCDVCVIGGGVIGLAVAFELRERGRAVTVLEGARVGERAAASRAAGMIAPAAEADISHPQLTRLALASHRAYPAWVERVERASGTEVGFDRTGTIFAALHRDHLALLEHLQAFQQERGLDAVRLPAVEARRLEPMLAPGVAGALLLRHDYQVDPRRLLPALAAALRTSGGALFEEAPVRRVSPSGGGYEVIFERDGKERRLRAAQVVMAAGARARDIESPLPPLPLVQLPLRPVKGQILRLRGEPVIRHVVRTPDVYIVPRAGGELVVGATMEEQGFDDRTTAGAVLDLLREARRAVPAVYDLELAECNVGFRPALRDHMPAIGVTDSEGLFMAVGHFRSGVELAPITARTLADLMCDGRLDELIEPLSPERFREAVSAER